jgi:hypothetical protein
MKGVELFPAEANAIFGDLDLLAQHGPLASDVEAAVKRLVQEFRAQGICDFGAYKKILKTCCL